MEATVRPSLNNSPFVVAGPTGSGKSAFAVDLALRIGGEVVCADAFQVYSGMALLTAQPPEALTSRVIHHLYGIRDPSLSFDAAAYTNLARERIDSISANGKIPVLVGGSGLYLKALTGGLDELPQPDSALRRELSALPLTDCLERLRMADPQAPGMIDCRNPRRVVRALEIVLQTGRPLAQSRTVGKPPGFRGVVLARERGGLNSRIEANVRAMFTTGVVEEVVRLGAVGPTASRAIGLREIRDHLAGQLSLEDTIASIVLGTRRYAKRQATWFRHQTSLPVVEINDSSSPQDLMKRVISLLGCPA